MKMTPEEAQANNLKHFMKNGPGLSYAYQSYIVAKDTKNGFVMLGGLGGMGVGQMRFKMSDGYKAYPGWDEAPEKDMGRKGGSLLELISKPTKPWVASIGFETQKPQKRD